MGLTRQEREQILAGVIRYAAGDKGRSLRNWLSNRWGGAGDVLGLMLDLLAGHSQPSEREIGNAVDLLGRSGFEVGPGPGPVLQPPVQAPPVQPPPIQRTPSRWPTGARGLGSGVPGGTQTVVGRPPEEWPPEHEIEIIDDQWPEEHAIDTRRVLGGRYDLTPGGDLTEETFTPQSSNVFSFQYDKGQGILYVTYRAPGETVASRRVRNVCTGKMHTIAERPFQRGPTYAYGGAKSPVPRSVYESMLQAGSKGRFVWQRLRVCGSLWQHQYPYRLTEPAVMRPGGREQIYTPRKATARGFRQRSVIVGHTPRAKGAVRVVTSNLPERLF